MESMTGKERMLMALSNKQPDRVPVSPVLWCMIPCKMTGKPFWEVMYNNNPPLWKANLDAVKHFGYDGFFDHTDLQLKTPNSQVDYNSTLTKKEDRWEEQCIIRTPEGDLSTLTVYPKWDPPTLVKKPIVNIEEDFKKIPLHL